MKKSKRNLWNPYLVSYLSLAIFCCMVLSIVFSYINLENLKRNDSIHTTEKVRLVADDLDHQMEILQKINLQISVNKLYQPYYFQRNKYFEITLLNDFVQYKNYSPLVDEFFLYFKGDSILFHSDGTTIDLDIYLNHYPDQQLELKQLLANPSQLCFYSLPDSILILMPLSTMNSGRVPNATLCMRISYQMLEGRLQTVSGGLAGPLAIYAQEQLIYSNGELLSKKQTESIISASDWFRIYYQSETIATSYILPLQILAIIAVIILMLFIATIFAWRSYRPLLELTRKYHQTIHHSQEAQFASKLEEINYIIESVLKTNHAANAQLELKQEQLKKQILLLLLSGNYSFDIQPYLSQVGITLPGPWYFVLCISYGQKDAPSGELYQKLRNLFDGLTDVQETIYVYSYQESGQPLISVLCSISDSMQKDELCTDIRELAESYEFMPAIGIGNSYNSLGKLPASYLEAVDKLHQPALSRQDSEQQRQPAVFSDSDFYPLRSALSIGNEEAAIAALHRYMERLKKNALSFLMQQYQFTSFLNEVSRLSHECRIELSRQSMSLILSAKNLEQFSEAAEAVIHDFCVLFRQQKEKQQKDESWQVVQYLNEHFMNYELSIELVASELNTSTAFVRSSIQTHTGRSYKDYLIYLRMEYAKKLLAEEGLTVAETCQRIGYTNISYFIKLFKSQTGVTPANYKHTGEAGKGD